VIIGENSHIYMTRGDTESLTVNVADESGESIQLDQSATATMTVRKKRTPSSEVIFSLDGVVDGSDIVFAIMPSITQELAAGNYVYDIEITSDELGVKTLVGGGEKPAELTLWQDVTQHGN